MAKPSRDLVAAGVNGWDAAVNNNFIRLLDQPPPIFLHTGDETDLTASFNPANFEEAIVVVDHTVIGLTLYMVDKNHPSGVETWVPMAVRGAGKVPPAFKTGTTTLGYDELRVIGDPGAAATYTLRPAADMAGLTVEVKNISAFTLTVEADAAETIDTALNFDLTAQFQSVSLYSDGTEWHIL